MNKTFGRLRLVFLGLFVLATIATWTYQIVWVQPRKACEGSGRWWSGADRVCATPVSVSTFTGRPTPLEVEAAKSRALP